MVWAVINLGFSWGSTGKLTFSYPCKNILQWFIGFSQIINFSNGDIKTVWAFTFHIRLGPLIPSSSMYH